MLGLIWKLLHINFSFSNQAESVMRHLPPCRFSMLKIALGAEFNSEKMFKDVAALSRMYKGVQLHTHVAENPVSTSAAASICLIPIICLAPTQSTVCSKGVVH